MAEKKYTTAEAVSDVLKCVRRKIKRMQALGVYENGMKTTKFVDGDLLIDWLKTMDDRAKKAKGGRKQ